MLLGSQRVKHNYLKSAPHSIKVIKASSTSHTHTNTHAHTHTGKPLQAHTLGNCTDTCRETTHTYIYS